MNARSSHRQAPAGRTKPHGSTLLWITLLAVALAWSGHAGAQGASSSSAAVAAHSRYLLLIDQARKQIITELKPVVNESMQAGQLEEANRVSKIVASQGEDTDEALTSLHGKAAQARFRASVQRATQEYVATLKRALEVSLRSGRLEESNGISAEIKRLEGANARLPDSTTGFINLLASIDPEKDAVAGKWTIEKGALVSSGDGQERIEIPYQAPAEYDFRTTFTKTGNNCVVQILSELGTPFIWVMGANGSFTFHYLKGAGTGGNKTSVQKPPGIKDGRRYTSLVRVRKTGVEALLDGRVLSKWDTDYNDVAGQPFWALRDKNLLGLGLADTKTIFHTVEIKEVSGPGKFQR